MYWDDLVERWRREHRAVDPRLLRPAGGHVAVLPSGRPRRRRSRISWLLLLALVLAALVLFSQADRAQAPSQSDAVNAAALHAIGRLSRIASACPT